MSRVNTYSLPELAVYVDCLDAEIQAAVIEGNIVQVTFAKKREIVSRKNVAHIADLNVFRWQCGQTRTFQRS